MTKLQLLHSHWRLKHSRMLHFQIDEYFLVYDEITKQYYNSEII